MQKGFHQPESHEMPQSLSSRILEELLARGLLSAGQAHRVGLVLELDSTGRAVVSGRALADGLQVSRAAVHKHVGQLRSLGFNIESVGGVGYRMNGPPDDLVAAEAVIPLLLGSVDPGVAWIAGLPYRYLARCPSTNRALRSATGADELDAAPAGALVITDEQTGGRGRLGRGWISQPGKDLTFSVLLRPNLAPARAHRLSLAAALAVAETLEAVLGLQGRVGIKWPNDVMLDGRKVCGILVEGSMDSDRLHWAIAGIGLNVNGDPETLTHDLDTVGRSEWEGRPEPTSLRYVLGRPVPRALLLARLLTALTARWSGAGGSEELDALRSRDLLRGREVDVVSGPPDYEPLVSGEACGIGEEGQLLVRTAGGPVVTVFAGDVSMRSVERLHFGTRS
jgi:BirA family biotin operon repressor/biotin-[acetyl-CoA-carboxylase] ligase